LWISNYRQELEAIAVRLHICREPVAIPDTQPFLGIKTTRVMTAVMVGGGGAPDVADDARLETSTGATQSKVGWLVGRLIDITMIDTICSNNWLI